MSVPNYTHESLKQMKGQAVKDIWHALIGKPAGIKNTTGLRNAEEIIEAILKGQSDPEFLRSFGVRPPKPKEEVQEEQETESMPPKKKSGPKPKLSNPIMVPVVQRPKQTLAVESNEVPLVPQDVIRRSFRKFHVNENIYFIESNTHQLFSVVDKKPGMLLGIWDASERAILPVA
jgi:hypothetical protein